MDAKYKLIIDSFGKERFKFNELIKDYTELKLGGPARLLFVAFTARELIKIVTICRQLQLPYFLFGTGSKIAISDAGFDGLMIKNRTKNIQKIAVKGRVTRFGIGIAEALIETESGVSISRWSEYLNAQGLETADFDNIPGSIGGNLFFSKSLQNRAKSIKVLDPALETETIDASALRLKEHVIISAVFKIKAKV